LTSNWERASPAGGWPGTDDATGPGEPTLPPRDSISVSDVNHGQLIQIKLQAPREGGGGMPERDKAAGFSGTAAFVTRPQLRARQCRIALC
jgi:hypothetical protein